MTLVDLEPAARRLGDLVGGIPEELLDAPTPCPAYTVGDLVDHVAGTALAFRGAAVKDQGDATSHGPSGDASRLGGDWRTRIPRELAAHGWDVARATGQTYDCDAPSLEAVHDFVSQFSEPGQEEMRAGLFGPVVEVPEDARLLDRVIGLTGRDPAWSPR